MKKRYDFIHLHNHTDYSLMHSIASVEKLVAKAVEFGCPALAITDSGNMFGVPEFFRQCKNGGIKPIIGCEFFVAPESRHDGSDNTDHLILLARNNIGYKNLVKLSSLSYLEGYSKTPRIDNQLIERYAEGLIAMSGCIAGELPKLILAGQPERAGKRALWYRDVLGLDNFYLELQDHNRREQKIINKELVKISKKTGIPLVCTNNIHYVEREDAVAHDIMRCIRLGIKKNDPAQTKIVNDQLYFKGPEEMNRIFAEVSQASKNTRIIAEKCSVDIIENDLFLPDYPVPEIFMDEGEYLKDLTYNGLKFRYGTVHDEIRRRADMELEIINALGFSNYFLIVWDYVKYAKENEIPVGPGRGSSAGSIVAFALQITDVDPLKFGLIFERFLNPERNIKPDFDIDFCFDRRQDIIDYTRKKYGPERVGHIITFGTYRVKTAVRDVARALAIPYSKTDEIVTLIPSYPVMNIDKAMELENESEQYAELFSASRCFPGLHRQFSAHAAGIVIGRGKLSDLVPLCVSSERDKICTQFSFTYFDDFGLVKFDILGLKPLTAMKKTIDQLKSRGIHLNPDTIPLDDEATFELFRKGDCKYVFNFESMGMQEILRQLQPDRIEDLIALNALFRPGPMDKIPLLIELKHGHRPITYPHPGLEPFLKETYGMVVYQEQVMEIIQAVAGFSLGKADVFLRAMGKRKQEEIERLKADFVRGAQIRGVNKKEADEIFFLLSDNAGIVFNKSHAVAYSIIGFKCAYLKTHYRDAFVRANGES